jgi:pilus assembly protein Flp/PilA
VVEELIGMMIPKGIPGRSYLALLRDRRGATAVEYGLLAAGISVAIIATVFLLGGGLDTAYQTIIDTIEGGNAP